MFPRVARPFPPVVRRLAPPRPRLLTDRHVEGLVSVAGLVGLAVLNASGGQVAVVVDVVVRWNGVSPYPPLTGLVVRIGRRRSYLHARQIETISADGVRLSSARVSLEDFERREGEVVLVRDVLDHQLVDVDGVQVVRAADLYLATLGSGYVLVGVDVSPMTLLRRLGPRRWRRIPTPDRVVDWAAIQPFAIGGRDVPLAQTNGDLRRLRPGELADLLEGLASPERQQLLAALDPGSAADALEEMEADDLESLLRETPTEQAARLLAGMEPDEAAEALRALDAEHQARLLAALPALDAQHLATLARFADDTAGGLMTTVLVTATEADSVGDVRRSLAGFAEHRGDIDAVLIVDADGLPIDDLALFDLLIADPSTRIGSLVAGAEPITVPVDAPLDDAVAALMDSRRGSLIVIDDDGRAIGRILADDVIDALVPARGRRLRGLLT